MKLINTTDYSDVFLRRMVSWCCRQIGLPVAKVRKVTFRNRKHGISGHCWSEAGDLVCSVSRAGTWFTGTQQVSQRDRIAMLVDIVAHELAHRLLFVERSMTRKSRRYGTVSRGGSEQQANWFEKQVAKAFEADREALVAAWEKPRAVREAKPVLSVQDTRRERAEANMVRWQRKLKFAQNKVAKYRRQVRYYEKAIAAKRGSRSCE